MGKIQGFGGGMKSKIISYLENHKNKTVLESEIYCVTNYMDYQEYYDIINQLVNELYLRPMSKVKYNGMNPPLMTKYYILKEENDVDRGAEIRALDLTFNISGYLDNRSKYERNRMLLLDIDRFLKKNSQALEYEVSMNERSLQIFFDEKKMIKSCKTIFDFNPELFKRLNCFMTPEPFFTHNVNKSDTKNEYNILIIENKDTWYSLVRLSNKYPININGTLFDMLLYGEGKKVTRKINSLTDFTASLDMKDIKYFYFGDLDYQGISIFEMLKLHNSELEIELFSFLYKKMLDIYTMSDMKVKEINKQEKINISQFLRKFSETDVCLIEQLLSRGEYIPQEILNCQVLLNMIRGD